MEHGDQDKRLMTGNFIKFIRLNRRGKRLLSEAVLFMFLAKFLLAVRPVKSVLGISFRGKPSGQGDDLNIPDEIKNALMRADRLSFWKNRCLVKSIAGRWMLQRRNIPCLISFGVMQGKDKKLIAHAWLTAGRSEVVEKGGDYIELSAF
jgi:hypothetical protein